MLQTHENPEKIRIFRYIYEHNKYKNDTLIEDFVKYKGTHKLIFNIIQTEKK